MTSTCFVSDIHLCETRPHTTRLFLDFLAHTASKFQTLYILGDLFEYWAGDDDVDDPHLSSIVAALRQLSDQGTSVRLMHGNRDFLIGENFAQACGSELLADPMLIDLHGHKTLITHGDLLCTDDVSYQQFRSQVRDPIWQKNFLALPLADRKIQISALRQRSEIEKSYKSSSIMDVNAEAVAAMICAHGYPQLLIHGHTHRPGRHRVLVQPRCERIVLGDWDTRGSYLVCDSYGCNSVDFP